MRTEVAGAEINCFGRARRDGEPVLIVGETKLRPDERRESRQGERGVLSTLERKIAAVRSAYSKDRIVPLSVTYYARLVFRR